MLLLPWGARQSLLGTKPVKHIIVFRRRSWWICVQRATRTTWCWEKTVKLCKMALKWYVQREWDLAKREECQTAAEQWKLFSQRWEDWMSPQWLQVIPMKKLSHPFWSFPGPPISIMASAEAKNEDAKEGNHKSSVEKLVLPNALLVWVVISEDQ